MPVVGQIHAGDPTPNDDAVEEMFPVRTVDWTRSRVITRVIGDSMAPTLIDGDYIALGDCTIDDLRPNRDIIVAEHAGENTVKRWGGLLGKPRHCLLTPDNRDYDQLLIPLRQFRPLGRVVWMHREM